MQMRGRCLRPEDDADDKRGVEEERGKAGMLKSALPRKPLYFPPLWLVSLAWASICYFCHYSTPQTRVQSQDTHTLIQGERETQTKTRLCSVSFLQKGLSAWLHYRLIWDCYTLGSSDRYHRASQSPPTWFTAKTHFREKNKYLMLSFSFRSYERPQPPSSGVQPPATCTQTPARERDKARLCQETPPRNKQRRSYRDHARTCVQNRDWFANKTKTGCRDVTYWCVDASFIQILISEPQLMRETPQNKAHTHCEVVYKEDIHGKVQRHDKKKKD